MVRQKTYSCIQFGSLQHAAGSKDSLVIGLRRLLAVGNKTRIKPNKFIDSVGDLPLARAAALLIP